MTPASIPYFFSRPPSFEPKVEISVVWMEHNEKILFLQRSPLSKYGPHTWAPLGGKLERGEKPLDAAIRETQEEIGIYLNRKELHFLATLYVQDPRFNYTYHMYRAVYPNNAPLILSDEHQAYIWVDLKEALDLNLMTGIEPTIAIYASFQNGNVEEDM